MERRTFLEILGSMCFSDKIISMPKEEMNTKPIPSTGEKLPVVGLGTWQTFDVPAESSQIDKLQEVLIRLVENGGSVVDSSPMYGKSEETVGLLQQKAGLRKSLFMATKVWTRGKEAGIRQMNESFDKLQTQTLDLMQIHNLVDWKTHLPVLRQWKEEGKIRYLGVTHYHEGAYSELENILQKEPLDFLQINYSLRRREAEKRVLPLALEKEVAVLINQPFESGSLFSIVKGKPLPDFAREIQCTSWSAFFLKFILAHPAVTCVIPGTAQLKHLEENLSAGYGSLPDEAMRKKMSQVLQS